jgi:hypothetical protein
MTWGMLMMGGRGRDQDSVGCGARRSQTGTSRKKDDKCGPLQAGEARQQLRDVDSQGWMRLLLLPHRNGAREVEAVGWKQRDVVAGAAAVDS